jgi:hypothetical protein
VQHHAFTRLALALAPMRTTPLGTLHQARCGRPAYHPASLLKIYIYGYFNRAQSSRRLEIVTSAMNRALSTTLICFAVTSWRTKV